MVYGLGHKDVGCKVRGLGFAALQRQAKTQTPLYRKTPTGASSAILNVNN